MFEEKCQDVPVFHAKDLEKIYLEILSENGIQYGSYKSRFASLLVSDNYDLEKRNIGSKITVFSLRTLIEFCSTTFLLLNVLLLKMVANYQTLVIKLTKY